jgi:tRNA dimethylallyltransferase
MPCPEILVIVGPTASGKSALAVELARQRNGEVISADSRQVYKGLDIGTGKIRKRERKGVRHHLLDVASPKKIFTAHDFVRLGRIAIKDIHARGKLPIICGGTGFYIDALIGRTSLSEIERNDVLRKRHADKTAAQLYALLQERDPARAVQMDTPSERNNAARLIRALEVAAAQKKTQKTLDAVHYNVEWIGVDWPDAELRKRIHTRLLSRIKGGMVGEAKKLHSTGLSWRRMDELGLEYRYLARYLRGTISKADMIVQLENEIWHYAKRQRTWWKRNPDIHWATRK